jgi:acyl-coenzyme A synthetase/AMP-(fatty) acid ligase
MELPEVSGYLKDPVPFNFAADIVDRHAEASSEQRAMLWTDNTDSQLRDLSFAYFSRRSHLSACLLQSLGVSKGDKMMILLSRVPAW